MVALALCAATALSWLPGHAPLPVAAPRAASRLDGTVFKTPKSTDTAAEEQARRAAVANMSPAEYTVATRDAANAHLSSMGAHAGESDASGGVQSASFLKQLWDVDSIPAVPAEAAADPGHVLATVYEIGGPLTDILSTSVAKKLPLIPHVGARRPVRSLDLPSPTCLWPACPPCKAEGRSRGMSHSWQLGAPCRWPQASVSMASSTSTRTTLNTAQCP